MKLWQLKNLKTGEALNEPQPLPENWGPIFGLHGFIERIGELSWLGNDYKDMGWFVVGDAPPGPVESTEATLVWEKAKQLLRDSDWSMLPDIPMTNATKSAWIAYRKTLREIKLQVGFPNNVQWPKAPE